MPLDAQTQAYLDEMAALGLKPASESTVEEARENIVLRLVGPVEGRVPVHSVEDGQMPGPAGPIPIRVYRPSAEAAPILVFFHGGGWVIGNLETHDDVCRRLANAGGCVVVSIDYRLAPEHTFPAAPEDCYTATRWVAEHARELGGVAGPVAVGGDSAGGNLTAVVALMARERGGPAIALQVLIYPVTDYNFGTASYRDNADGYGLTLANMQWFWNHYLNDPAEGENPYASPLRAADLRGLPPALVLTAEYDPLRDEGDAYADRLCEAGVPTTLLRHDGLIHGFINQAQRIDRAKEAMDRIGVALREAFKA